MSHGIVPARDSLIRLVGAVLAAQHDECSEQHGYIGLDVLAKSRPTIIETEPEEMTVTPSPPGVQPKITR